MAEAVEAHVRHIYEGEPDEDLIVALEPDQLVEAKLATAPLADLGPRARAGLWVLRIWVLVLVAMVLAVFVANVLHGH